MKLPKIRNHASAVTARIEIDLPISNHVSYEDAQSTASRSL